MPDAPSPTAWLKQVMAAEADAAPAIGTVAHVDTTSGNGGTPSENSSDGSDCSEDANDGHDNAEVPGARFPSLPSSAENEDFAEAASPGFTESRASRRHGLRLSTCSLYTSRWALPRPPPSGPLPPTPTQMDDYLAAGSPLGEATLPTGIPRPIPDLPRRTYAPSPLRRVSLPIEPYPTRGPLMGTPPPPRREREPPNILSPPSPSPFARPAVPLTAIGRPLSLPPPPPQQQQEQQDLCLSPTPPTDVRHSLAHLVAHMGEDDLRAELAAFVAAMTKRRDIVLETARLQTLADGLATELARMGDEQWEAALKPMRRFSEIEATQEAESHSTCSGTEHTLVAAKEAETPGKSLRAALAAVTAWKPNWLEPVWDEEKKVKGKEKEKEKAAPSEIIPATAKAPDGSEDKDLKALKLLLSTHTPEDTATDNAEAKDTLSLKTATPTPILPRRRATSDGRRVSVTFDLSPINPPRSITPSPPSPTGTFGFDPAITGRPASRASITAPQEPRKSTKAVLQRKLTKIFRDRGKKGGKKETEEKGEKDKDEAMPAPILRSHTPDLTREVSVWEDSD